MNERNLDEKKPKDWIRKIQGNKLNKKIPIGRNRQIRIKVVKCTIGKTGLELKRTLKKVFGLAK